MKDPAAPRFPTYVAELLEAERVAPPPGRDARDRVRARVAATVLAATAVGAAGSATAAGATATGVAATKTAGAGLLATFAAKATLVAIVVTAGATGTVVVHRRNVRAEAGAVTARHASSFSPAAPPAVLVAAPPVEAPPAAVPATPPASAPTSRPAARAPAVRAVQTASALADENALVEAARAALGARAPARAAALLERHARLHPHGQMEEEREALWVQALAAAGDGPGARARAENFRRRFPRSIQLDVVSAALETIP